MCGFEITKKKRKRPTIVANTEQRYPILYMSGENIIKSKIRHTRRAVFGPAEAFIPSMIISNLWFFILALNIGSHIGSNCLYKGQLL